METFLWYGERHAGSAFLEHDAPPCLADGRARRL
jgi:hypothetical protein